MTWVNIEPGRDAAHYSIMRRAPGIEGMYALREMFPGAKADAMNFVLFSTSGVHGTYNTIEDAESALSGEPEKHNEVTFLIVHPRLVALRYGTCAPSCADDVDFLKRLRASSHAVVSGIGL